MALETGSVTELEESVLLCSPVDDQPTPVEGSVRHRAGCGHNVWVSPSGLGLILDGEIDRIVCAPCAARSILAGNDIEIMPLTEAQIREVERERASRRGPG